MVICTKCRNELGYFDGNRHCKVNLKKTILNQRSRSVQHSQKTRYNFLNSKAKNANALAEEGASMKEHSLCFLATHFVDFISYNWIGIGFGNALL
jgi:hypothetical protein